MSITYQRMLEVLKRWPMDKAKGTRDYGMHLRELTKRAFPNKEVFQGTEAEKNEIHEALLRLADNKYGKMYASSRTVGASGLTIDQLKVALSEDFVKKYLK